MEKNHMLFKLKFFDENYLCLYNSNEFDKEDLNFYISNYYAFLNEEKNYNLFLKMFNIFQKIENKRIENRLNLFIKASSVDLKKANFDSFKDIILTYFVIFSIKTFLDFSRQTPTLKRNENLDTNQFLEKNKIVVSSDDIINDISEQIFSFKNALEIKQNTVIDWNDGDSRKIITIFLDALNKNKILSKNLIKKNSKTYSFYELTEQYEDMGYSFFVFFTPFKIFKKEKNFFIQYNVHFSSVQKVLRSNPASGSFFELPDIMDFSQNLNKENWLYLDTLRLEKIIKILSDFYKINLNKINIEYSNLIAYIKKAIKINDVKTLSLLSAKIPQIITLKRLLIFLEISKKKKKMYISFFKDFRGRKYDNPPLSLTFYKELRYASHRGEYSSKEELLEHSYTKIINPIIEKYISVIKKEFNLENLDAHTRKELVWIVIAASEHRKAELGKKVHISDFVHTGISELLEYKKNKNAYLEKWGLDVTLKIDYLHDVIEDIISGSNTKWLISKDATASCFQHQVKLLGPKDDQSLKHCNLNDLEYWYDTYAFFIESFINTLGDSKIDENTIRKLFNRNISKKIIMTENYGSGIQRCKNYFIKSIKKNKDCSELLDKNPKEVIFLFEKFYKFLSSTSIISKKGSDYLIEYINNQKTSTLTYWDKAKVDFKYFEVEIKQVEFKNNGRRITKQEFRLTTKRNKEKEATAARANLIQSVDACLIRWYLRNNWAITVHDCFLIDYKNITFLIAKINEGMRVVFHDLGIDVKIDINMLFSTFILL